MENLIKLYEDFLNEAELKGLTFTDFAKARLAGATKISDEAKKKGGPAMLTHQHFVVKLPHYKKAAKGKFNPEKAETELDKQIAKLNISLNQTQFQKTMGIIEVLGELLIRNRENS